MRRNTLNIVKFNRSKRGFTLIEMAISLIVIGLLIAPAISAYNIYQKNKKIDETSISVDITSKALEGFLGANGRYPCPAPRDAVPGDVDYGFEQRDAATGRCLHSTSATPQSGVIAVASNNGALTAPNNLIMIGTVPFKTINAHENESYDGYDMRLTYAITEVLTDPDTYQPNMGGITINKKDDSTNLYESALAVDDTAHYVVISHGPEMTGGFTSAGVRRGTCPNEATVGKDFDNCNDDNTFVISEQDDDFDDTFSFTGGVSVTPWQYADSSPNDVHLKLGGERVLGGITGNPATLDVTSGSGNEVVAAFEIRNSGHDDDMRTKCGSLPFHVDCLQYVDDTVDLDPSPSVFETARDRCEANLNSASCTSGYSQPNSDLIVTVQREEDLLGNPMNDTGAVVASQICENVDAAGNGINCFDPNAIGGADVAGSTPLVVGAMGLPFPGTRYASGTPTTGTAPISGGNLKCPAGEFMVGIREGQIICSNTANFDCPSGQILSGVENGRLLCQNEPDPPCSSLNVTNSCGVNDTLPPTNSGDSAFSVSGQCYMIASFDGAYANTLTTFAQLQAYVDSLNNGGRTQQDCDLVRDRYDCNAGSWSASPVRTHEFGRYNEGFPSNINSGSNAEVPGGPYQSFPNVLPPAFNATNNPNTDTNHDCWCREDYRLRTETNCADSGVRYYVDRWRCGQTRSRWQTNIWNSGGTFCTCTPQTGLTRNGGTCASQIPGSFDSSGVTGNVVETYSINCPYSTTVTNRSFANCSCPARSDQIPSTTTNCPAGTSNSFTFDGQSYTNKSFVRHRRWTCPAVSGDLDTAGEVGFWTNYDHSEPCGCVDGFTSHRDEACPPNQMGVRRYETVQDCATGTFSDTGTILQQCQSCKWTKPSAGSPQYSATSPTSRNEGDSCNCNSDSVGICKVPNGSGFDYWNDCSCDPS